MSKVMIGVWVDPEMKETAKRIAKIQGIKLSEYCRHLIIQDFEQRSIITTKIKEG